MMIDTTRMGEDDVRTEPDRVEKGGILSLKSRTADERLLREKKASKKRATRTDGQ